MADRAALIIGAGDGTGGAIAKRFAREGFVSCVVRRDGGQARPAGRRDRGRGRPRPRLRLRRAQGRADGRARRRDRARRRADRGRRVQRRRQRAVEHPARRRRAKYFKIWEMACFGGFLMGREVAKRMVPRGRGTILFTGATASRPRAASSSPPSPAPSTRSARSRRAWRASSARRASTSRTSSSTARSTPSSSARRSRQLYALKDRRRRSSTPTHIAEQLLVCCTSSPADAWTFELDLRPWMESW